MSKNIIKEEWLYIMDYADAKVYKLNVTDEEDDDIERILTAHGFNLDECAYMYSYSNLTNIEEIKNN